jgi:hypothetical protein
VNQANKYALEALKVGSSGWLSMAAVLSRLYKLRTFMRPRWVLHLNEMRNSERRMAIKNIEAVHEGTSVKKRKDEYYPSLSSENHLTARTILHFNGFALPYIKE